MKVNLEQSNDKLRQMREGVVRARQWIDGYKAGRHVPGQTHYNFAWEMDLIQIQILLDSLISSTNPK